MSHAAEDTDGVSIPLLITQCLLIFLVFYLWSSPIIQPVKVMVVLFHEMSHGLMAVLSGGRVLDIAVTADEGGACETEGGWAPLIVSAGYLGSMIFGGLLLYLSKYRGAVPAVYTLLTLVLASAIFTVLHDPFSRTFAVGLAACFIFLGLIAPTAIGRLFLRVVGTVSCLYSILDIYWDVLASGRAGYVIENDAVAFSSLTGVPSQLVGVVWLSGSAIYFLSILRIIIRQAPGVEPVESGARGNAVSAKA